MIFIIIAFIIELIYFLLLKKFEKWLNHVEYLLKYSPIYLDDKV